MKGDTDLNTLLASLSPALQAGEYVYCSFAGSHYGDHAELSPIAACQEAEGLTLVVPRAEAEAKGLAYDSVFRVISLGVHSSLEAVGLTAVFASQLADHGISANVVAGYFHDHIFVPAEDAERALAALRTIPTA